MPAATSSLLPTTRKRARISDPTSGASTSTSRIRLPPAASQSRAMRTSPMCGATMLPPRKRLRLASDLPRKPAPSPAGRAKRSKKPAEIIELSLSPSPPPPSRCRKPPTAIKPSRKATPEVINLVSDSEDELPNGDVYCNQANARGLTDSPTLPCKNSCASRITAQGSSSSVIDDEIAVVSHLVAYTPTYTPGKGLTTTHASQELVEETLRQGHETISSVKHLLVRSISKPDEMIAIARDPSPPAPCQLSGLRSSLAPRPQPLPNPSPSPPFQAAVSSPSLPSSPCLSLSPTRQALLRTSSPKANPRASCSPQAPTSSPRLDQESPPSQFPLWSTLVVHASSSPTEETDSQDVEISQEEEVDELDPSRGATPVVGDSGPEIEMDVDDGDGANIGHAAMEMETEEPHDKLDYMEVKSPPCMELRTCEETVPGEGKKEEPLNMDAGINLPGQDDSSHTYATNPRETAAQHPTPNSNSPDSPDSPTSSSPIPLLASSSPSLHSNPHKSCFIPDLFTRVLNLQRTRGASLSTPSGSSLSMPPLSTSSPSSSAADSSESVLPTPQESLSPPSDPHPLLSSAKDSTMDFTTDLIYNPWLMEDVEGPDVDFSDMVLAYPEP